jgi:hypothetical protein
MYVYNATHTVDTILRIALIVFLCSTNHLSCRESFLTKYVVTFELCRRLRERSSIICTLNEKGW